MPIRTQFKSATGSELHIPTRQADTLPARIDTLDGSDIRFRRLPSDAGLSQTRVATIVQDNTGFIWFGTQYGLNRYDGYRSKVFRHVPDRAKSLSCVYIRSLFVDHAGRLWVGCEGILDRYEPATETFAHYRIGTAAASDQLTAPIDRIGEDRTGILWLATADGLYRLDPATGTTTRYIHDPHDPASLASSRINMADEDRQGRLWVATIGGLEELDGTTGRVVRRSPVRDEVSSFHEDDSGIFWMREEFNPDCSLASWNPGTDEVRCHSITYKVRGVAHKASISAMLEDRRGTMWFSSTAGLLRLDRVHNRILRYHNAPLDSESLASDSIINLYQDREGDIWTAFQAMEPNFFSERPQPFDNFTYQRGDLLDPLVTSIYQDHNGILWIASMAGLNRIDRVTGKNTAVPRIGNEILSILEDPQGVLFCGTFHTGLLRLDRETGTPSRYSRRASLSGTPPIMRLIYDHQGNLWAATYGGVGRYDPATGKFILHTPENQKSVEYQDIREDRQGFLWVGGQSGLHRFDPRTGQFRIHEHHSDDPRSLSDNRVNSIHFDHQGTLWVGTQDGLDKFDPATGAFRTYFEQDGLAGDVVSCILEDKQGVLWMGTNNGLSSFDPQSHEFRNFYAADGLPGRDLTGWGACYQSPSGEMFFGGFSGATAFYPERLANSSFVPKTVLTDFRLSGNEVPIGAASPLKQSITATNAIRLSHRQNVFSIEFSALSFFNAPTNRYRYRLIGLGSNWRYVGSDQRIVSYTTLPVGTYRFEVEGATSRGPWSQPASLLITILPAWYQTVWFRAICAAALLLLLWAIYQFRVQRLHRQFAIGLEAQVGERLRIARELHDTLLQSLQGAVFQFQAARKLLLRNADNAMQVVDEAIRAAEDGIAEGRAAIRDLRPEPAVQRELPELLSATGRGLADPHELNGHSPRYQVIVEGKPRIVPLMLQDEIYRISREVIRNAFRHAAASHIEVEIRYDEDQLRLRIRDDGRGIDPTTLGGNGQAGHWGIQGIRERAQGIGVRLDFWSEIGAGTEVEITVPAVMAYERPRDDSRFHFFRRTGNR